MIHETFIDIFVAILIWYKLDTILLSSIFSLFCSLPLFRCLGVRFTNSITIMRSLPLMLIFLHFVVSVVHIAWCPAERAGVLFL
jgi:hypothetical protein